MPDRIARLSLICKGWTGWSREQPEADYATAAIRCGQRLTLGDFGIGEEAATALASVYNFQIRLMTLLADRAFFEFQHLVTVHPNGGISLMGPYTGIFILRPRQRIRLATPTMDGGLHLTIALDGIDETAALA